MFNDIIPIKGIAKAAVSVIVVQTRFCLSANNATQ